FRFVQFFKSCQNYGSRWQPRLRLFGLGAWYSHLASSPVDVSPLKPVSLIFSHAQIARHVEPGTVAPVLDSTRGDVEPSRIDRLLDGLGAAYEPVHFLGDGISTHQSRPAVLGGFHRPDKHGTEITHDVFHGLIFESLALEIGDKVLHVLRCDIGYQRSFTKVG